MWWRTANAISLVPSPHPLTTSHVYSTTAWALSGGSCSIELRLSAADWLSFRGEHGPALCWDPLGKWDPALLPRSPVFRRFGGGCRSRLFSPPLLLLFSGVCLPFAFLAFVCIRLLFARLHPLLCLVESRISCDQVCSWRKSPKEHFTSATAPLWKTRWLLRQVGACLNWWFPVLLQPDWSATSFILAASPLARNGGGAILLGSLATLNDCHFSNNTVFQVLRSRPPRPPPTHTHPFPFPPLHHSLTQKDAVLSGMGGAVLGQAASIADSEFARNWAFQGAHIALFQSDLSALVTVLSFSLFIRPFSVDCLCLFFPTAPPGPVALLALTAFFSFIFSRLPHSGCRIASSVEARRSPGPVFLWTLVRWPPW